MLEVQAFSAAETLGPPKGVLASPIVLPHNHCTIGTPRDIRLLCRAVTVREGHRVTQAVATQGLHSDLPVVSNQRQASYDSEGDDQAAVLGCRQARYTGWDDIQSSPDTGDAEKALVVNPDKLHRGFDIGHYLAGKVPARGQGSIDRPRFANV